MERFLEWPYRSSLEFYVSFHIFFQVYAYIKLYVKKFYMQKIRFLCKDNYITRETKCKNINVHMFIGKMSYVISSEWSYLWNGLLRAP